jgi:hypothetical protein
VYLLVAAGVQHLAQRVVLRCGDRQRIDLLDVYPGPDGASEINLRRYSPNRAESHASSSTSPQALTHEQETMIKITRLAVREHVRHPGEKSRPTGRR